MNWKHAGIVALFFVLGLLIIGGLTLGGLTLLFPLFAILYLAVLVLYALNATPWKRNVLIALLVMYLLIIAIPFPRCDNGGKWGALEQTCTCIGVKRYPVAVFDAWWSDCIGIPINYECTSMNLQTRERIEVPCNRNV